jgi:hypothetical protein
LIVISVVEVKVGHFSVCGWRHAGTRIEGSASTSCCRIG